MRMRFWSEITRELAEKHAECFPRAPFTPKPGHMTQSPCLKVFENAEAAKRYWAFSHPTLDGMKPQRVKPNAQLRGGN
ncbi:MAG: hypothetical protein A2496_08530 [Burkholderiales bacterium RIFOXYC12_FULL_60_6]|nr:MAG: hypothetical protein A2503_11795 [Burkholderiales bacterium RIFOXYD12_FULL_59_19]OGB76363.1 MAG: hypothetical protein A2496_08530 [Burkholderiales bacterium RIFOXYC12_FULL_60_6]